MSSKEMAVGIGTAVVAGTLYWLFGAGGMDVVKDWIKSPSVNVRSESRSFGEDIFFATEKLNFSLKNVRSERVFWIFDEKVVIPSGITMDFAFEFLTNSPPDAANDHRVDAIYRRGDGYRVSSVKVRVLNQRLTAASLGTNQLRIAVSTPEHEPLKVIDLGSYDDGAFKTLWTGPVSMAHKQFDSAGEVLVWDLNGDVMQKLRKKLKGNGTKTRICAFFWS
jgi:hypothetical protein